MKAALGVIGFLVFVGALIGGALFATRVKPARPERPPLPAMSVIYQGQWLALQGPRPKPLLLHLWASWCGPCKAELPELLAFPAREARGSVDVLAISVDDYWEPVVAYFGGAERIPREIAWDKQIITEKHLGVGSIPATFLVDTDGNIARRWDGAHRWDTTKSQEIAALVR